MTVYSALDEKMQINFFSGPIKRNSKSASQQMCAHIGSFIWDGFNTSKHKNDHRVKTSRKDFVSEGFRRL